MKNYWSGLFVAGALAATASLGAQAQNPANTPPADSAARPGVQRAPLPPSAQTRTPTTVTVTGCVQNAPMATASTAPGAAPGQTNRGQAPGQAAEGRTSAGAADAGASAGRRFVLTSGRMASTGDAGRTTVGTTGTAVTTYQLDGQTADISAHVNHRVEITGMLQDSPAAATGSANAAAGAAAAGPTLRVTSVRMLSMTCDDATPGTTGVAQPGTTPTTPGASPSGVPSEPRPQQDAPAPRPRP